MALARMERDVARMARVGVWLAIGAFTLACGPRSARPAAPAPLATLVGQAILVTPVQRARAAPELGWSDSPRPAELSTMMDSALAFAFREREVGKNWSTADALVRSHLRNPTYATDPKSLSVEAFIRPGTVQAGTRLPDPLASQLRTMVALQEGRMVLIPLELRLESAPPGGAEVAGGGGRAVLRLMIVDARMSDVRWMSEIVGDPSGTFGPGVVHSVAQKVANLFASVND